MHIISIYKTVRYMDLYRNSLSCMRVYVSCRTWNAGYSDMTLIRPNIHIDNWISRN